MCSGGETGSASVVAVSVVGAVLAVLLAVLAMETAFVARHRAATAADLSALTAADTIVGRAVGEPCEMARRVAAANAAELDGCDPDGVNVTTIVGVSGCLLVCARHQGHVPGQRRGLVRCCSGMLPLPIDTSVLIGRGPYVLIAE